MNTFRDRLNRALDQANKSQYALARDAGLTQGYVSRLCGGKKTGDLSYSVAAKIARALGVSLEWLMEGVGPAASAPAPDRLAVRATAIEIARQGGVPEEVLSDVQHIANPFEEHTTVYAWISFIQHLVSVRVRPPTPPPSTLRSLVSGVRPRADTADPQPVARPKN